VYRKRHDVHWSVRREERASPIPSEDERLEELRHAFIEH
jgi:hypothetical protein